MSSQVTAGLGIVDFLVNTYDCSQGRMNDRRFHAMQSVPHSVRTMSIHSSQLVAGVVMHLATIIMIFQSLLDPYLKTYDSLSNISRLFVQVSHSIHRIAC